MGNNLVKSESLGYFNLARGVGIVMVLIGHSMNPLLSAAGEPHLFSGAGSVLGGGIMAAFFMISGFGFYKRNKAYIGIGGTTAFLGPWRRNGLHISPWSECRRRRQFLWDSH